MNLRVHYYIQPYTVSCRTSNTIKAFWNVEHQIHISVLLFSYLNLLSTSSLLSYSVHSSPLMAFERDLYSECMKTQTSNVGRPNFFKFMVRSSITTVSERRIFLIWSKRILPYVRLWVVHLHNLLFPAWRI